MNPGETFFGHDFGNHLWIVLSSPTRNGLIALVNLTTHGRSRRCGSHCVVVHPGEHPYPKHASCVFYTRGELGPVQPLDEAKERRRLRQHEPLSEKLLRRVQEGALGADRLSQDFKDAVRETLQQGQS